jgi:phospholipid-binding lipoprotein MlaA
LRTCLLIVVGIVVGAGCATSTKVNPQSQIVPPSDVNSPGQTVFDDLDAELSQKQVSVADPLEPVNRVMYGVNDVVFFWVLKPVVQAYTNVVPKSARTGIRNFFRNLATPARLANCLLQGKGAVAGTEVQRFGINTVVGVAGFGDPARDRWGLKPAQEDLGQTLAVYGLGDGFYLVWPLLGPSTLRDSVGMVGDGFMDPVRYVEPQAASIGLSVTDTVNGMSFYLGEYETLKAATLDPYIALREAYIQYRTAQIRDVALPQPGRNDPNR